MSGFVIYIWYITGFVIYLLLCNVNGRVKSGIHFPSSGFEISTAEINLFGTVLLFFI